MSENARLGPIWVPWQERESLGGPPTAVYTDLDVARRVEADRYRDEEAEDEPDELEWRQDADGDWELHDAGEGVGWYLSSPPVLPAPPVREPDGEGDTDA